ncbi:oxalurate catabolism protein HpxZ [Amphritea sp. 2_MG-2023]|uniref:oxalurate catabolism protein HpxZ n=1 Tax=Amphritea TaxID=515417 RepID=UPI001C06D856|nr:MULTISPECIES: oxalurate catabolism protein HpxZ [Amphritea]MBU2965814.1 oxalurate catabolism protein HpxZ [Amphritea atlantica]MDO6417370.1 oxalurate catabolism protein HpxZ [Amphritea sp. 2_MG-2023]
MNLESISMDAKTSLLEALDRLYAVRPEWTCVRSASDAISLAPKRLLHAGPPFADPRCPSPPVLSSAVLCCLYEGWADTEEQALALIASGQVRLLPAQDYRVVLPLAALVSPSTSLVEVADAARPQGLSSWSILSSGFGPQIRFGSRDLAIIPRMVWRDQYLAPLLHNVLQKSPVDLLTLAVAGLQGGDDLHSCTTVATATLARELHLPDGEAKIMLDTTPLFFLTLWMAACHQMLDATRSDDPMKAIQLVLALAGNGIDVGVRLADEPERWITTAAQVPQGPKLNGIHCATSPMLGDSGVIDAAGFGAQAWSCSSEAAATIRGWMPALNNTKPQWLVGQHPVFNGLNLGSAIDAACVSNHQPTPLIAIAMLEADGHHGLLGRGVCQTDPTLFGAVASCDPVVNEPKTFASLNMAFERYEQALIGNDIAVLDELFWDSPHTLRYGSGEHLYGYAAIQAFRRERPGKGLARTILERSISTFDSKFAITNMVFTRDQEQRQGRQTQSWVRIDGAWRIVAAHVSWADL